MKNKLRRDSRSDKFTHIESIPLPVQTSMDDIATLTDDALIEALKSLESDKEKAYSLGVDAVPWETEIAYHRREVQIRRQRREAHDAYIISLENEAIEAQKIENTYPVADLDNSAFMFFN